MSEQNGERSLSRSRKGFTVAASPFNAVKFDLAIILVLAVVVLFVHSLLSDNPLTQLVILFGFGVMAMLWLIVRTKKVLRQNTPDSPVES